MDIKPVVELDPAVCDKMRAHPTDLAFSLHRVSGGALHLTISHITSEGTQKLFDKILDTSNVEHVKVDLSGALYKVLSHEIVANLLPRLWYHHKGQPVLTADCLAHRPGAA